MKKITLFMLYTIFTIPAFSQLSDKVTPDSILGHRIQKDLDGKLLAWHEPQIQGAGYIEVAKLASEFIKNAPVYEPLGLKMYFISCCFQGPHMTENKDFIAEDWMHNPAGIWAGLVQGLVLDYRVFSGDDSYLAIVRDMLVYQLENGTTPSDWIWPNAPYASSDPFEAEYRGAARWQNDGMRGDGLYGIEPDKVGELGIAYLKFYEVTEEKKFLEAAVNCADALAKHVRDVRPADEDFVTAETKKSPWPFRINAQTGIVISEYCSNVIEPVRLFDEFLRYSKRFYLTDEQITNYKHAHR